MQDYIIRNVTVIMRLCSFARTHIKWKLEVVGLSEPFMLLARGQGPTESGNNYAMEKDEAKLD